MNDFYIIERFCQLWFLHLPLIYLQMRETLKELRVILLNISHQKPLYIQERPGPEWLGIVALFGLIPQLYSSCCLVRFRRFKS
jgi:hypothetical protein